MVAGMLEEEPEDHLAPLSRLQSERPCLCGKPVCTPQDGGSNLQRQEALSGPWDFETSMPLRKEDSWCFRGR